MRRSAVTFVRDLVALGALLVMAYPCRWTNEMIGHPRINICVLLAAMSLVVGCAKPVFEQPRLSVGQTVPPPPQAGPQASRVSIGDTVVVSLEGTPVSVPPFTNQVASDGTVTIWNSLHFKAAGLTTDELASQIRWTLVTNWVHIGEVKVLKDQRERHMIQIASYKDSDEAIAGLVLRSLHEHGILFGGAGGGGWMCIEVYPSDAPEARRILRQSLLRLPPGQGARSFKVFEAK